MFLVLASRSGEGLRPGLPSMRRIQLAGQTFWVGWDGNDFQWSEDPDGWTLRQEIFMPDRLAPGVVRVGIEFDRHTMTMMVRVSSVSGTPVYYHETPSGDLVIGSRVQLLRSVGVPIEEDASVLPEFLTYRCLLAPATLFRNIRRVPQGGVLTCTFGSGKPILRLTSLVDRLEVGTREEGTLGKHVVELTERVSRTLGPLKAMPGNVAMLLSGGIDSSILCRLGERNLGLHDTVSTGYPFESTSEDVERRYALTAAEAMGFDHRYYESTTPRYLAGLVEAIGIAEAPVSHLQSVCMHLLMREGIEASRSVVLQGLGAGGCVGNFRNFLSIRDKPWAKLMASAPFYHLLSLAPSLTGRGATLLGKLRDMRNRQPLDSPGNPIWKWHQYGDASWVCDHFNIAMRDITARHIDRVCGLRAGSLYDSWALYSLLGDEEATVAIWASLAAGSGKTFYFPFYDEDFIQYAMTIPWTSKLGATENVLRKSMARGLGVPDFILNRRKSGFGIRRDDWALEGGVFEPLAWLGCDMVDEKELAALRSREPGKAMLFWNLLNYALWKRICVDDASPESLCAEIAARTKVA